MEKPDISDVPSKRIRRGLQRIIDWAQTFSPQSGEGIRVSQFSGQGSLIALDKSTAGISPGGGGGDCAPSAPPGTGTWVWGSVDGVCQWIDTTTC